MLRKVGLLFAVIGAFGVGDVTTTDTASASSVYNFDVELNSLYGSPTNYVYRLDPSKTSTVRVVRLGAQVQRDNYGSGATNHSSSFPIHAGDVVQVYQPSADVADPPAATPVDTFTVPDLTLNAASGSAAVSGAAEDGSTVRVQRGGTCAQPTGSIGTTRSPGAYTGAFADPSLPGDRLSAFARQPDGDRVFRYLALPGETPCLDVDASTVDFDGSPGPGYMPGFPFRLYVSSLMDGTLTGSRTVLRRGGTAIADSTEPGAVQYQQAFLPGNIQPVAGDTIEVYRPAAAGTPSYSWTLPRTSAVFDPAADLVAVDGTAAQYIVARACRAVD